jgi:DNA polymerase I
VRTGIKQWPRLESGRLDIDGDAFRLMYHEPGIEALHALRDSLNVVVKAKLPIGRDGRNRPSLFPFCTATGRNAHSKSLYNNHASMRSFMVFPQDTIGVYLDWRTQEVGIAAALSGDQRLIDAYLGGDVYHALALACGFTDDPDPQHWKKTNPEMRNRMKRLQLAINYGMGVPSLAKGLNSHPLIASNIIEKHRREYPPFWKWREDMVKGAMMLPGDAVGVRMATSYQHESEQAHAVQLPHAEQWRRDVATGGVPHVRGRYHPVHVNTRRSSARSTGHGAGRTR